MRYEVPEGLSPEEERAVLAALERHFEERDLRPNRWAFIGRLEATRQGVLQNRRLLRDRWHGTMWAPFAQRGTEPIRGRGDLAKRGGMGASKLAAGVTAMDRAREVFQEEGCSGPHGWGNAPGDTYGWHSHSFHKVLFCLAGGITFHTREGDIELEAGDRLDLEPETEHAATVGNQGVSCVEASR